MHKSLFVPIVAICSAVPALGDHHCFRARPVRNFCHLPCYEFRGERPKNLAQQTTSAALPLTLQRTAVASDGVVGSDGGVSLAGPMSVKVFQLSTSEIRIQHCRITQVVMTVVEDGSWIVNCVAEQNVGLVDSQERPPLFNYRRNRFFIDLRGVGVSEVEDPPSLREVGQPQLFHVTQAPFWVEAGEKRVMRWTGQSAEAKRFFSLVNRVDIDLRFE